MPLKSSPEMTRIISWLRKASMNYRKAEKFLIQRTEELRERNKELNCLYGISRIVDKRGSLEEILKDIVNLVASPWQHHEIAAARIVVNGDAYKTANFRRTKYRLVRNIAVDGKKIGEVEVCYLRKVPAVGGRYFLPAERHLLEAIAERTGKIIQRKLAEKSLLQRTEELRERNKELNCLYGISRIVDKRVPLEKILKNIVNLVASPWQHHEIAAARIVVNGDAYKTANFRRTKYRLIRDIAVDGKKIGEVEVCYIRKVPAVGGRYFLPAERHLLEAIAKQIAKTIVLKRAEEQVIQSHIKLRELFEHIQSAREEERKRIAREIHDEFGQALATLKIDVRGLRERLFYRDPGALENIDLIEKIINSASQNLRRVATELRPALLDDFGLVTAIGWQADNFEKRSGIRCHLSIKPKKFTVDSDLSLVIYRIVQELLTNVFRHAAAAKVRVNLEKRRGRVLLRVADDGRGIRRQQMQSPRSFGLRGVRERVSYWGGKVSIQSCPGEGTTVEIGIPLPKRTEK